MQIQIVKLEEYLAEKRHIFFTCMYIITNFQILVVIFLIFKLCLFLSQRWAHRVSGFVKRKAKAWLVLLTSVEAPAVPGLGWTVHRSATLCPVAAVVSLVQENDFISWSSNIVFFVTRKTFSVQIWFVPSGFGLYSRRWNFALRYHLSCTRTNVHAPAWGLRSWSYANNLLVVHT